MVAVVVVDDVVDAVAVAVVALPLSLKTRFFAALFCFLSFLRCFV